MNIQNQICSVPQNSRQLKYGTVLSYIALLLGNCIGLLYTPFMLRILGQNEYGLFSLANSIVGCLTVFDFGLGSAAVRYTAKYRAENNEQKLQTVYGMFIAIYTVIGLITLISGILISFNVKLFFSKGLTTEELKTIQKLLILASLNLAVSFPFGVFTSIITAYEKFIFLKTTTIVRQLLTPAICIPILLFGYKSVGLIVAAIILNFIFLFVNFCYCFSKLHVIVLFRKPDFTLLKEIFSYAIWIFIGSIATQLWWNSGHFLLGVYSSPAVIAIYSVAMQFKSYFESFATAITGVFLPKMTAMVSSGANSKKFTSYFIRIGRLQYIILALITTGFILFGKQFISIWAGNDYQQVYLVTLIIFIPLLLVDSQTLGITILQAKNKHKFRSILYLCITVLCIILCIPFIRANGAIGCAIATSAALTIGNLFTINWYYHKKIGLDIKKFWFEIIKITPGILSAICISFFSLKIIPELNSYKKLLPAIAIYILLYFFILYIFSFNSYEKKLMAKLVNKITRKRWGCYENNNF